MKKPICFIMILAAAFAALALAACGKKDNETSESSTDIVAEIPYVSDFTCDYFTGNGFNDRAERNTAFGSEDEVLIKLSFTLSPEAFNGGKKKLTIKPILSEGFVGSIVSANTSAVNNIDLTAAFNADDRKSKNCEIGLKAKFNHSNGKLQIGYSYDGDEYQTTGSYSLSCSQPLKFTYDAETDGFIVLRDMGNEGWLTDAERDKIPDMFAGKPVTAIGEKAFASCENLVNITIPDTIVNIGDDAFRYCSSLTSITIPYGVTNIGRSTFSGCSSLTNITIPDSVTSIGAYAFSGCDKLKCNEYGNAQYLGNEQNPYIVFIKAKNADDETITNIDVNKTTKFIHSRAFVNCVYLTSITIPDSVRSIGEGAFMDCRSLTNIEIPDSVTSIGSNVFYDCRSLTNIEIPDSVTSIGHMAFSHCSNLTNITIPDSVTSIGSNVFYDCDNLQYNIYGNAKYLGNKQNPYVVFIELIDVIVESVDINSDTKIIYHGAIRDCKNLKNITMPDCLTSIGESAFDGCSSLTSITIPDSVIEINYGAFKNCSSLTNIAIPDSVTSIGENAFFNCENLTSISFSGTKEQWLSIIVPKTGSESESGKTVVHCTNGDLKFDFGHREKK